MIQTSTEAITSSTGNLTQDHKNAWRTYHDSLARWQAVGGRVNYVRFYPASPLPRLDFEWNDGRRIFGTVELGATLASTRFAFITAAGSFTADELAAARTLRDAMVELIIRHGITSWTVDFVYT